MRSVVGTVVAGVTALVVGAYVASLGSGGLGACTAASARPGGVATGCVHAALTLAAGIVILAPAVALLLAGFVRWLRLTRLDRRGEYRTVPRSWDGPEALPRTTLPGRAASARRVP